MYFFTCITSILFWHLDALSIECLSVLLQQKQSMRLKTTASTLPRKGRRSISYYESLVFTVFVLSLDEKLCIAMPGSV